MVTADEQVPWWAVGADELRRRLEAARPWPTFMMNGDEIVCVTCPLCSAAVPIAVWTDTGKSSVESHTDWHVETARSIRAGAFS